MSDSRHSRDADAGRVPLRRIALWVVVAVALVVGLALFFRFGR